MAQVAGQLRNRFLIKQANDGWVSVKCLQSHVLYCSPYVVFNRQARVEPSL